jgi:uncharacterized protein
MSEAIRVVQEFYRAVGAGDVPRIVSLLSDELAWTEAERFPYYSGVWRCPQEVLEKLFVPLSRDWEEFSVTPAEFIADGQQVVSLGRYEGTYRATQRSMSALFAHRWIVREGKIVRFDQYTDTAKVLEALAS